ncbi:DEAD/DEAH box helicase [Nonomuraea cavernae]|uniref:DEAD/DEAH box helicase n=1 Tax=Nonomuraea cavernae TaxID=2045107 RepID=UPI0033F5B7CB
MPDGFTPYRHQARAFERLSTLGKQAEPTLIATGTGSGKTESFLLPVLDRCCRKRAQGRRGVKAVLLYPMNALADRLTAEEFVGDIDFALPLPGPEELIACGNPLRHPGAMTQLAAAVTGKNTISDVELGVRVGRRATGHRRRLDVEPDGQEPASGRLLPALRTFGLGGVPAGEGPCRTHHQSRATCCRRGPAPCRSCRS